LLLHLFSPYWIEPPYELKVEYIEKKYAENALNNPGVEKIDEVTTLQNTDNLSQLRF
jgi:D-aminopeptidase